MSQIIDVTDSNFDEVVAKSELPVLVDFWAPWCGPCRMMGPRVEKAAADYDGRIVVAKYNCDESQQIAAENNISAIPTIIVFKKGEAVDTNTGAVDQATLNAFIERNL